MTIRIVIALAAVAIAIAACDKPADAPAPAAAPPAAAAPATPAPAAAEIAPAAAPATPEQAALDAERAKLAALSKALPDEKAWNAACVADKVDAKICDCAGKVAVKQLGVKGLYAWVWQGYVNKDPQARLRSNKFFVDNAISKEDQQKFADAVGKCFTY